MCVKLHRVISDIQRYPNSLQQLYMSVCGTGKHGLVLLNRGRTPALKQFASGGVGPFTITTSELTISSMISLQECRFRFRPLGSW